VLGILPQGSCRCLYQRVRRPTVAVPPTAPRRTVLGGSWRDGTKPGDYLDTDVRDADCCSSRGRACSRARLCILDPPYSAGSKTLRATKAGRPTESNQHLFERALNIASERIVGPGELARMLGAWQVPLPARSVHGLAPPGISGDLVLQRRILDTIHARRAPRMVAAKKMRQAEIRRLIVLNREKPLVGIVSLGDLAVLGNEKIAGNALEGVAESGREQKGRKTSRGGVGQSRSPEGDGQHVTLSRDESKSASWTDQRPALRRSRRSGKRSARCFESKF